MKVILLADATNLGKKYDVKVVSDGYALNFLFPRGLAEAANPRNLKRVEELEKQREAEIKIHEDLLMKNLHSLEGVRIEIFEKANKKGHLFAGIHKPEIISVIKKQTGLDIDEAHIELNEPIKTVGDYEIKLRVSDKKASFKLVVQEVE